MKNFKLILLMVASITLTSTAGWAKTLSQVVYDFDDTLISTTAETMIFPKGQNPKAVPHNQVLRISTADWAEVRHQVGKVAPYENYELNPDFSFLNFSGQPGTNAFLGHLKETLAKRTAPQWQAPKWNEFVKRMETEESAQNVFILTARSSSAQQIQVGFQFLQAQGLIRQFVPAKNIFAVSDPTLRLKSDQQRVLAKEPSEVAKTAIMQEMLDELEKEAVKTGALVQWAFYDDDYANFAKARDHLIPQASMRWPHVDMTIGYVGFKRPGVAPHNVVAKRVQAPRPLTEPLFFKKAAGI